MVEEVLQGVFVVKDNVTYNLLAKFGVGKPPMLLCEGTHMECLQEAKNIVDFLKKEHQEHHTGFEFKETMQGTNIIMVHGVNNTVRFPKSKLWMIMEIKVKPERKAS